MFLPRCLATGIGSLPHVDADSALNAVLRHLPSAPFWPQLPQRGPQEGMCAQFLPGLPGWEGKERLRVKAELASLESRTSFFERAFRDDETGWPLEEARVAGYAAFMARDWAAPPHLLKGQITGPITMGISITDQEDKPVLYDHEVMELICTQLRQLARGQENRLREKAEKNWSRDLPTLVFIDEPWMAAYGSAFATFGRQQVIDYLSWVMEGIAGLKAVHCCANTDWSLLLATPVDVLSFDAYDYGDKVLLFAEELAAFLKRGGYLAWGIVPSEGRWAQEETVVTLSEKLLDQVERLARHLPSMDYVLARSFITPACGLGNQTEEAAENILRLTSALAVEMQSKMERGL